MKKVTVIDCNWSWGQLLFDNPADAAKLFEILGKAQHIDNRYLYKEDGDGRSVYYVTDREISPTMRTLSIVDADEFADAVKVHNRIEAAKEAAKAAEKALAEQTTAA